MENFSILLINSKSSELTALVKFIYSILRKCVSKMAIGSLPGLSGQHQTIRISKVKHKLVSSFVPLN